MSVPGARPRWKNALAAGLVALAIGLPRLLALDRFVTPDEPKWLARSGNFFLALSTGDLAGTFTREHPGVTVTWAGTIGFLLSYPEYPRETPGRLTESIQIGTVLRERGRQPLEVLLAGRLVMVLAVTAVLAAAYFQAARLVGAWPALAGFLLIAFDPFHVGLTRLLHLDGLASSLALLSLLALMGYFLRGRRTADLLLSGIAAGFGWLTKSPVFFLAPFAALLGLAELARLWLARRCLGRRELWQTAWPLALWSVVGWLTFVAFWPAMWVAPIETLGRVFAEAGTYAAEGHSTEVFFNGRSILGDPGKRFYPLTYLWRSTPFVLGGLALAGVSALVRRKEPREEQERWLIAGLALFAALFAVFMTLGAKKFDRYLLPIYAPLDLAAGLGWVAAGRALAGRLAAPAARRLLLALPLLAIAGQAFAAAQTYPYYLSYYNPLMGGGERAPQVMMIGWGEGIDLAARYLNEKPGAEALRVMSWYPDGSFSYFFEGQTVHAGAEWKETKRALQACDYVVTYVHQWQRGLPFPEMLELLSKRTPERTFALNGIEYVRLYKVQADENP